MRQLNRTKQSQRGFTLIELLAVIAIIGILASIVVPNVTRYIARANVTKAVSEIKNAETALIGMLSDTRRTNFNDFLNRNGNDDNGLAFLTIIHDSLAPEGGGNFDTTVTAIRQAQEFYNEMFYELIRQGRESEFAEVHLDPAVRNKLGTTYMDLGNDPWGNPYQFWIGARPRNLNLTLLRSYRVRVDAPSPNDSNFELEDAYVWDEAAYIDAKREIPGQPRHDNQKFLDSGLGINGYGYPASKDLAVYIYSLGPNLTDDSMLPIQLDVAPDLFEFFGGGDDPNNWDKTGGWDDAPK